MNPLTLRSQYNAAHDFKLVGRSCFNPNRTEKLGRGAVLGRGFKTAFATTQEVRRAGEEGIGGSGVHE